MNNIKFSRETKKAAMKQGAFSILMSLALLIGVIGLFLRQRTDIAPIFLIITLVSFGFSVSFIIKLRKLESINYLVFEKDRFELNNNFASKGRVIMFNEINKVVKSKQYITLTVGKKTYNILMQHISFKYIKEVQQFFMKYNKK